MSPRRKLQPDEGPVVLVQTSRPRRRLWIVLPGQWKPPQHWGVPLAISLATAVAASAISVCAFILVRHESHQRVAANDKTVLISVRSFMAEFTSVDPFHANDYVDRVLAHATGDFAKQYRGKENEILLHVAQAEPTTGTVLDAGVERWNDDGSANVLVVTDVTAKSPDGKQVFEKTSRWAATAKKEGDQWKISSLLQVI
ncbi:mammalian cell entry protein [Mycobacterium sp. SM1]|uniref:mammalian cell entry protein n=1 Tax=Mycobacterium sp. SM1 TaxID=2816243 RepID=UPI001BCF5E79|nr:mammalian cell entry protein [Mycobacterium sp. SM1]MBS4727849.1 mammalian cell entry protein [Mycobacterium sp. SM1]